MNRNYDLNLKLWGSLIGLALLSSALGLYASTQSIARLTGSRAASISQSQQIESLERHTDLERAKLEAEADRTQAAIDNNINLFSSVTLADYTCDPDSPPTFDSSAFVKTERVNVADRHQRVIGHIQQKSYGGAFIFEPYRCQA